MWRKTIFNYSSKHSVVLGGFRSEGPVSDRRHQINPGGSLRKWTVGLNIPPPHSQYLNVSVFLGNFNRPVSEETLLNVNMKLHRMELNDKPKRTFWADRWHLCVSFFNFFYLLWFISWKRFEHCAANDLRKLVGQCLGEVLWGNCKGFDPGSNNLLC